MNKKAMSPLIATMLLVVFALIIGTATMSWGRNYVETLPDENVDSQEGATLVISYDRIDNPLKELQIKYIIGNVDLEEYLQKQDKIVSEGLEQS